MIIWVVVIITFILLVTCVLLRRKESYFSRSTKLIKVLKFSTETLDKHDIPYWLYHGTLLGIIRDRAIIDGDNDVDSCIPKQYVDKLMSLQDYCTEHGYILERFKNDLKFTHGIPIGHDFCRITDENTGHHMDIGLAISTKGFLSDPSTGISNTLRQTWRPETIFPLRKINIFDSVFTIPNDYDTVNFAQYNDDCYKVRKSSDDSLAAEDYHNEYTKELLIRFQ